MNRATFVLLAVAVGTYIVTFDGAAVQMALPILHRELHIGVDSVQWAMTSFLLVNTLALLPAGQAGDVYGHARVWRLGLLIFILASVTCALVPDIWWLNGARAFQGLGAALTSANSMPLLIEAFPRSKGRALGLGNISIALGLITGPPFGALLAKAVSWRLIFVVAPPVGLIGLWLARGRLPSTARLPAGSKRPSLFDVSLFRNRTFVSGAFSSLLGYAALFTITIAMPFYLELAQRRNVAAAGLIIGVMPVALSCVAPFAGSLADRIGSRLICTFALLCVALSCALLSTARVHSGLGLLIPSIALAGIGVGGFEAPNGAASLGALPDYRLAIGTATLNTLRQLGMTFGGALAAMLVDYGMRSNLRETPERVTAGVHLALMAGVVLAGMGALVAALRPARVPVATPVNASSGPA